MCSHVKIFHGPMKTKVLSTCHPDEEAENPTAVTAEELPSHSTKGRVQRLPRYSVFSGQRSLLLPSLHPLANLCDLHFCQRWFPPLVDTFPLRQLDPFSLPLTDQRPFELSHGSQEGQEEVRHRRVLAGEGQIFFDELDMGTLLGEFEDNSPQVIQVSGQPVHAVNQQQVAFPEVFESRLQLWPRRVFPGSLVSKHLVQLHAL